jgi:hypothetical protein
LLTHSLQCMPTRLGMLPSTPWIWMRHCIRHTRGPSTPCRGTRRACS